MKNHLKIILSLIFALSFQWAASQCTISNLNIESTDCIEQNVYSFTFNFNVSENPNEFFDLYLNEEYYDSYAFEDLPVTVTEFNGSSSGVDTFLVCADETENCCADLLIESPCSCDYFNVETEIVSCNEDSLWFMLDFDYVNVSDNFLMGTPGFFIGTFDVNELPLLIGPFPRHLTPAEILISNQNDIFCFEAFNIDDEVCDQCNITNINAVPGECNDDGEFFVTLSFEYMNIGGNGFRVIGNNTLYGEFPYQDSILLDNGNYMDSLVIGPLPGDCETEWEFKVVDNEDEGCSDFTAIGPVCCEPECDVRDIVISEVECTSINTISFVLNFIYENPGNDFFHVYSGGQHVGMYHLENLPIVIESFPINEGETELVVCINDQESCCAEYIIEPIDCEGEFCDIFDLVVDEVECTSEETISFYLDFEYQNAGNSFYEIYSNDELIAYYPLNQLPMWIEDFPIGEEQTVLTVCMNDVENCCEEYVFEELDCSGFECVIGEISHEIEFINLDSFLVTLNFQHTGTDLDQFSVVGNGKYYGDFHYGELPIVLGPYNCHDSIFLEYIVRDLKNPDCQNVLEMGIVSCPVNTTDQTFQKLLIYSDESVLILEDPGNELENASLNVYTTTGQKIYAEEFYSSRPVHRIELEGLPAGIYIAEIRSVEKHQSFKIHLN